MNEQQQQIPHVTACYKAAEIDRMSQQIDRLYKHFFEGNGTPSVMVQMEKHRQEIKGLQDAEAKRETEHKGYLMAALSALFAGIVTLVLSLLRIHGR